jgi:hypothetical protein
MTKSEIINFIAGSYSDDEQLVWQVVSRDDLTDTPTTVDKWESFVETYDRGSITLADDISEAVSEAYDEFVESNYEDED